MLRISNCSWTPSRFTSQSLKPLPLKTCQPFFGIRHQSTLMDNIRKERDGAGVLNVDLGATPSSKPEGDEDEDADATGEDGPPREDQDEQEPAEKVIGNSLDVYPHLATALDVQNFEQKTLHIGRHTNITAQGRVFSFSALVLQGNGAGGGSLGYGKASTVGKAIDNAVRDGLKRMQGVYKFENRTIPNVIKTRFNGSVMILRPKARNTGIVANREMMELAELFGFQDLSIKTRGNRNVRHIYMAWFKAMNLVWSPTEYARVTGLKYVNDHAKRHSKRFEDLRSESEEAFYREWYLTEKETSKYQPATDLFGSTHEAPKQEQEEGEDDLDEEGEEMDLEQQQYFEDLPNHISEKMTDLANQYKSGALNRQDYAAKVKETEAEFLQILGLPENSKWKDTQKVTK
eukprot:TRINITY_DN2282_c0_g3_i2.p1 TRINITY_DN2282_c0_g3~~TRINITY_DN2282_c0_g3_i2.p1  ORF type:complete len:403 (-),score=114.48 TRINITY_DN2282_c0_g3_i2:30-1238(-)